MIRAETERLMRNWAMWKQSGGTLNMAVTTAYELEGRGRREETSIPLLNGEAIDVDAAVKTLTVELAKVVDEYWLRRGNIMQKVRRCRCAVATFYRRLDLAHGQVHAHMDALRQRSRRFAEAYKGSPSQTPLRQGE